MEKIKEIEIEGEGKQILELLMKKHRLTKKGLLQRYSEKLGIHNSTITQYLKNKAIHNDKFKASIEDEFGKSYEKIVKTAEEQIIFYIESMRNDIHIYNQDKDLINTNELIRLCQQHDLQYHKYIAMGNRARIKGNMRLNSEAKLELEAVIEGTKTEGYMELYIYYITNLAYIYNTEENYSASRKKLRGLETLVKEPITNKMILHKYWYIYGITMKNMGMYPAAAEKFKLAYEFANNLKDQIKSLINVALCYKLDRRYTIAMEWNEKALVACGTNLTMKSTVLNNIAIFYYERGDSHQAKHYINKALEIMPKNIDVSRKINILDSYLLIEEVRSSVVEDIIDILLETSKANENRRYLYRCLDTLISKLILREDLHLLFRLRDQLNLLIKVEKQQEDALQLKARFADIMIYLMEKGGVTTC